MKLSEFENITRETLHRRILKPSDAVWNTLEDRLSKQRRKRKLNFIFGGVAASIAFLLLVGLFVQNKIDLKSNIQTVDIPKQNIEPEPNQDTPTKKSETKTTVVSIENIANKNSATPNKTVTPEAIAEMDKLQNTAENLHQKTAYKNIVDQKVEEVVAKILDLKKNNEPLANDEINTLLAEALKEIKSSELLNHTSGKTDPNTLLADVEDEINNSFKEKVLLALRESYQTVKTAVAQSNN